jgi:hypothetical protein
MDSKPTARPISISPHRIAWEIVRTAISPDEQRRLIVCTGTVSAARKEFQRSLVKYTCIETDENQQQEQLRELDTSLLAVFSQKSASAPRQDIFRTTHSMDCPDNNIVDYFRVDADVVLCRFHHRSKQIRTPNILEATLERLAHRRAERHRYHH